MKRRKVYRGIAYVILYLSYALLILTVLAAAVLFGLGVYLRDGEAITIAGSFLVPALGFAICVIGMQWFLNTLEDDAVRE